MVVSAPSLRPTINDQLFLLEHRLVKLIPVVKIVQVHRVAGSGGVVGHAARAQNTLARGVIVVIAAQRSVMLFDRVPG